MEKATNSAGVQEIQRRLAPLKVTIGLLYRELEAAKGDRQVAIDRVLLESIIATIQVMVDDLDKGAAGSGSSRSSGDEKKFVETPRVAPVRQN